MYFRSGGRNEKDRYSYAYLTVEQFLKVKVAGKNISEFFIKNNFNRIAICGVETLGQLVFKELRDSNIEIKYFVNDSFIKMPFGFEGISVISADEISNQEDVDVFVITSLFESNEIIDKLINNGCSLEKIINLNDVVYGIE